MKKKPFELLAEERWREKSLRCPARLRGEGAKEFYCMLLAEEGLWAGFNYKPCNMENCTPCYWEGRGGSQ